MSESLHEERLAGMQKKNEHWRNKILELSEKFKVKEKEIHINLLEIEAKWIMEGGYIMPSPGEEDEWMEKVTKALQERKNALV